MNRESENYSWLLQTHIGRMIDRIKRFSDEQWVWQPSPPVPSAQMLSVDVLQWLVCDRQHILEPDSQFHEPMPQPPDSRDATVSALGEELKEWVRLFADIRVEDLDAPRRQFNRLDADHQDVRWMMLHALENAVHRLGEMTTLALALSQDGTQPYVPVLPADGYKRLRSHGAE